MKTLFVVLLVLTLIGLAIGVYSAVLQERALENECIARGGVVLLTKTELYCVNPKALI